MQTEEALIRLHKCLSFQLAYVDGYNVRLLLQWPRQFVLLIRRSVKARRACKSCRFYVLLNLLHVYLLVVTFSVYFTTTEWLFKKDRLCSERRQIIIKIIIIIPWTVCSNKQTDDYCTKVQSFIWNVYIWKRAWCRTWTVKVRTRKWISTLCYDQASVLLQVHSVNWK